VVEIYNIALSPFNGRSQPMPRRTPWRILRFRVRWVLKELSYDSTSSLITLFLFLLIAASVLNPLAASADRFRSPAAIDRSSAAPRYFDEDRIHIAQGSGERARADRRIFEIPTDSPPPLERISIRQADSRLVLSALPALKSKVGERYAVENSGGSVALLTIDLKLQNLVERLVSSAQSPHVAAVVMDPTSGRILSYASKSPTISNLVLHADFPAASLFKLVTSAAALEQGRLSPSSQVWFRGGTYTLNRYNYLPDRKRDQRVMSASEALGRSCNPAFARIALNFLDAKVIRSYAEYFGFNAPIPFDVPLPQSMAAIPTEKYLFSRTAAGFGDVHLSPLHAAALMSAIANDGIMPRPYLIDRVLNPEGQLVHRARPEAVQPVVSATTARRLREMMEYTTTIGTSRREFMLKNRPLLGNIRVAGKTGTLNGSNPKGMTNWFVGAAPLENPQVSLAVIVVDPRGISTRASHIGRRIFQEYFK
jgi:cell division protein FtsI/penicillin-binding protein 2